MCGPPLLELRSLLDKNAPYRADYAEGGEESDKRIKYDLRHREHPDLYYAVNGHIAHLTRALLNKTSTEGVFMQLTYKAAFIFA
jgi:hypothetical protein